MATKNNIVDLVDQARQMGIPHLTLQASSDTPEEVEETLARLEQQKKDRDKFAKTVKAFIQDITTFGSDDYLDIADLIILPNGTTYYIVDFLIDEESEAVYVMMDDGRHNLENLSVEEAIVARKKYYEEEKQRRLSEQEGWQPTASISEGLLGRITQDGVDLDAVAAELFPRLGLDLIKRCFNLNQKHDLDQAIKIVATYREWMNIVTERLDDIEGDLDDLKEHLRANAYAKKYDLPFTVGDYIMFDPDYKIPTHSSFRSAVKAVPNVPILVTDIFLTYSDEIFVSTLVGDFKVKDAIRAHKYYLRNKTQNEKQGEEEAGHDSN